MATKFECDVCKQQFHSSSLIQRVVVPAPENNYKYKDEYSKDWCNDCLSQLRNFIETMHQEGLKKK